MTKTPRNEQIKEINKIFISMIIIYADYNILLLSQTYDISYDNSLFKYMQLLANAKNALFFLFRYTVYWYLFKIFKTDKKYKLNCMALHFA